MQQSCFVDVIIITYYTGDVLFQCLDSASRLKNLGKIILVDNGNNAGILSRLNILVQDNPNILLVTGHGNIGFAKGCNKGASYATSAFLLFLNPDCYFDNYNLTIDFIATLSSSEYKVATCKVLNHDKSIQKTCRRNLLTPSIGISESFNLYKLFKNLKPLNLPTTEIEFLPAISSVPALSGALIFISSTYYKKISGFDEQYFLHVEDMDLCMRIHLNGDKIAFLRDISVTHMLSTSDTTSKFLEHHKARGFIIYLTKYFPIFRQFLPNVLLRLIIYLRYFIKVYL